MSDAATRAELEAAQVAVRQLARELDSWPPVSPERTMAEAEIRRLEDTLATTQRARDATLAEEVRVRASVDKAIAARGGLRDRWWMSWLAPVLGTAGLVAACWGSMWAIRRMNWQSLGDHYGLWVALFPFALNGLRVAWSGTFWLRKRRRAQPPDLRAGS